MNLKIRWAKVEIRENTLVVSSKIPLKTLSSAVLGGGFTSTKFILNCHVDKDYHSDFPGRDIKKVARRLGIKNAVGMMTAVDLKNAVVVEEKEVTAIVTGGVSNASVYGSSKYAPGTINIILLISANLSDAAIVTAVITATEAKTLALRDLKIKAKKSGEIATGTSTDAVVIACTGRGRYVRYTGSATRIGKVIGNVIRRAVREAIIKQENLLPI